MTPKQILEVCGGNPTYLDGIDNDMNTNSYAGEITTQGNDSTVKKTALTTDDMSAEMTKSHPCYGGSRYFSGGLRESSKKQWYWENVLSEESEHGNKLLNNQTFSVGDDGNKKNLSYSATKQRAYRARLAAKKAQSSNPEIARRGQQGLQQMNNNCGEMGIQGLTQQYNARKNTSKIAKNAMASCPKQQTKNKEGIIQYY